MNYIDGMEKTKKVGETIKGRVAVMKVSHYRGSPIYIRNIDDTMFEYLLIFNNQIYSDWIEVTPSEGNDHLTEEDRKKSAGVVFAAATTTVDTLIEKYKEMIASNPKKVVN